MITEKEVTLLQGLTKKKPVVAKATSGGTVFVHSTWFVLELPVKLLAIPSNCWANAPLPRATEWKNLLPPGDGEYAQGIRAISEGVPAIKLVSDSTEALIQANIFDFVMRNIEEPEFRIFPGDNQPHVAVLSSGQRIGGVAQLKP